VSRPTRGTPPGRAYLDLQNRARAEGRGTQELLTLYVVERWLARLSASPDRGQFVLKGGMLLAAFDARRPTADMDALDRDFANDEATVVSRVVAVAAYAVPDDGVDFRPQTVTSRMIRSEGLYPGVRVAMDCALAWAIVKLRLDVSFGDPVTPAPQTIEFQPLVTGNVIAHAGRSCSRGWRAVRAGRRSTSASPARRHRAPRTALGPGRSPSTSRPNTETVNGSARLSVPTVAAGSVRRPRAKSRYAGRQRWPRRP